MAWDDLRDPLEVRPAMTKGKTAPISSPENIKGLVRDISSYALELSNLAFLRNPPKRVKPTRADMPVLVILLTTLVEIPVSYRIEATSRYSSPKLAILTEVEALVARGKIV